MEAPNIDETAPASHSLAIDTPATANDTATQDLSNFTGNGLRKLTEHDIRCAERHGEIYKDIYRELQIKEACHDDFYDGILCVLRSKHSEYLKRGTIASLRRMTNYLLRGFGYICWSPRSTFQVPIEQLSASGDEPLVYLRAPKGQEHPDNARFYSICEPLWTHMRNVTFAPKAVPKTRGRNFIDSSPSLTHDTVSDIAHLEDSDDDVLSTANPFQIRGLSGGFGQLGKADDESKTMTPEQADEAILNLITTIAEIRAKTDPCVFDELWNRHIGRLDEIDQYEENEITAQPSTNTQEASLVTNGASRSLSNEPFMTKGPGLKPTTPLSCLVPPSVPAFMSIWISTTAIISAGNVTDLNPKTTSAITNATRIPTTTSAAYHWPNAPVENYDLDRFFSGINIRIEPPASLVLGYLFSYGWNDRCRFVTSGLSELGNCYEASEAPEALRSTKQQAGDQNDAFEIEQWAYIKLGWRDFQSDLADAARMGVKLWRMKVCVLTLTT